MKYTKLTYKIKAPKPYLFIGSKIRGILGYALKDEVCINPSFICEGCFALKECIFYQMYERENIQHDYRLDFKLYDNEYKFSLLLFNELQNHTKEINRAILTSLKKEYKEIKFKEKVKKLKIKKDSSVVKIEFLTPLRMKKNNRFITKESELDINDILLSIYKINLQLKQEIYTPVKFSSDLKIVSKNLYYKKLIRKSNKQNKKMNFGGMMGEIILSGVDKKTYRLLKLGEILACGKNRVFGLGKFTVEELA